jgi:hypothetical protein
MIVPSLRCRWRTWSKDANQILWADGLVLKKRLNQPIQPLADLGQQASDRVVGLI